MTSVQRRRKICKVSTSTLKLVYGYLNVEKKYCEMKIISSLARRGKYLYDGYDCPPSILFWVLIWPETIIIQYGHQHININTSGHETFEQINISKKLGT